MRRDDTAPGALPLSHRRAFGARHTRPRHVDGPSGIRLHLADDVEMLWPATNDVLDDRDEVEARVSTVA